MTSKSQVETIVESMAAIHIRTNLDMSVKNPSYDELLGHLVKAGLDFINSAPGKLDAKIKHIDKLFKTLRFKDSKYVMSHGSICFDIFGGQEHKPDVLSTGRPEPDAPQREFDAAVGYAKFIESVVYQHATVNSIGVGSSCVHNAMCRSAQTILEHNVVDVKSIQPFKLCCEVLSVYVWNGIQYVPYVQDNERKDFTSLSDIDATLPPPRSDIKINVASQRTHSVKVPAAAAVAKLQGNEHYHFQRNDVQYIITRGYGESPAGNPLHGSWICHEIFTGKYIDHDQYRSDLFERLNLKVG